MKKLGILALSLLIAGAAWAFLQKQTDGAGNRPDPERLVLTGSSTVAPLAAEIGKRFEALHGNVRVDVQTGGSSRGINDVRSGLADIGMASRALKENESGLFSFTIATDGIGMIVNRANPVAALSRQQIIAIYTGKITDWQSVGGSAAPIIVVNKAEGRSTLELFLRHLASLGSPLG